MFSKHSSTEQQPSDRLSDFSYVQPGTIYLDAACQSMRPQPVIDALTEYYTSYNACGGRVKYAWGQRVDEAVAGTRQAVLNLLKLSSKDYVVSFTLNTTYGLNLLLQQLPTNRFERIVTSHIEHNSVFLPTITLAKRLGVPRLVLDRADDGSLVYESAQLEGAVVVVNAASNIDGRLLQNIRQLTDDVHARGGIVIIDAAQAMAHSYDMLQKTAVDAICFSGHKMYGASLGVVVARRDLLKSLDIGIIGGGMVADVTADTYELLPDELEARLEPGLQAWGEIIALGRAITWLQAVRPGGRKPGKHIELLSERLYDGLRVIPGLTTLNASASPVVSVYAESVDAHRLAIFLSSAGIMVRSGYFCAHHYLDEYRKLPPLLRFSLGLHTTEADIDTALEATSRLLGGIR